ncbi:hypothetical protein SCHPADRAFT_818092 [Schizopora paradoxa]|uniref:DNA topoisomerase I n=1 Tax=Schizopora paradoxa TaxID=27342 RepID=A0A0H2SQY0_9AGAM|nr:hypothetical protein SCHPADRAFT_818092 [Schizopora paradoxa]
MPGASAATTVPASVVKANGHATNGIMKSDSVVDVSMGESENDDDTPPKKRPPKGKANGKKAPPTKRAKKDISDGESDFAADSEDEKPKKKARVSKAKAKKVKEEEDASDDDDKPIVKKPTKRSKKDQDATTASSNSKTKKAKKEKSESSSPKKKKAKEGDGEEGGEEEEVYKWWEEDPNGDGSVKWNTLEHNGVLFPPPYEPLPSTVKMKYNGKVVDLPPASEEVAGFYAALLESPHAQDEVFNQNFFNDFLVVLEKNPPRDGTNISKFELCDFRPMFEYFEAEKAKKKALTAADKKQLKEEKTALEEKYTMCLLDGRKEKVGNFRIEPPGLFRGRGEHPRKGSLKLRVSPEDITLNIGKGVKIPEPNMPGKWKAVQHDNTVTWLANWTENVNGQHKYVFLAAGSSIKGQSDMQKFEKARELKKHVDKIRKDYNVDLKSRLMADRQRATAMYFIDKLALRAGNEKGEDEADTVGCCSLRCEHVTLEPPNNIIFDFLGKDSIRFYKTVEVEQQVFKNIRIFKENKDDSDALFDRVTTTLMNKHLTSYMKGLTAKVFRTYNASITFQEQLDLLTPSEASVQEKLNAYNKANRLVAILCNHQRSVPKTHGQSMEKMNDKLRAIKYERMKLRHVLFKIDKKYKKKKHLAEDESDIDDAWIASYEEQLKEKELDKVKKKFAKDNEKLEAEGKDPLAEKVLEKRLQEVEDDFDQLEEERGTQEATLKRSKAPEKIEELIEKLDDKMKTHKLQIVDREEGKEVSLGTSKINYLDPRITAAWCKQHEVPIEKIFTKTLLTKFPWAMEVDGEWKF